MSIFVCSGKHINSMLYYLKRKSRYRSYTQDDLKKMAGVLLRANIKAYNERYNEEGYYNIVCKDPGVTYTTIEILKLLACYEYQVRDLTCYSYSEACRIINTIRDLAISNLKGYDNAPWGIN